MTYYHPVDVLVAYFARAGIHLSTEQIVDMLEVMDGQELTGNELLHGDGTGEVRGLLRGEEPYVAPTPAPNNRQARRARAAEERKTR